MAEQSNTNHKRQSMMSSGTKPLNVPKEKNLYESTFQFNLFRERTRNLITEFLGSTYATDHPEMIVKLAKAGVSIMPMRKTCKFFAIPPEPKFFSVIGILRDYKKKYEQSRKVERIDLRTVVPTQKKTYEIGEELPMDYIDDISEDGFDFTEEECRAFDRRYMNEMNMRKSMWIRDLTVDGIEPNPGPNGKNQKKKNNQRRNMRRPRRGNNANTNKDAVVVGTNQDSLMPNSKMVNFRYLDDNGLRNNGGAQFLAYAFRINDLVDIDPLILSGLISGYKEMMQFYTWARVMGVEIDLNITNNENFPVFYGIVFTNANLVGTLSSVNDAKNALESRNSTTVRTLAAKGGMDRDRIVVRRSLSSIVGSKLQYMTNLDYVNQISISPTLPIYATFIVYTYGANLGNGVTTALTFSLRTLCSGSTNLRA